MNTWRILCKNTNRSCYAALYRLRFSLRRHYILFFRKNCRFIYHNIQIFNPDVAIFNLRNIIYAQSKNVTNNKSSFYQSLRIQRYDKSQGRICWKLGQIQLGVEFFDSIYRGCLIIRISLSDRRSVFSLIYSNASRLSSRRRLRTHTKTFY